jgi:phospholipid transport system substrate-binding protein
MRPTIRLASFLTISLTSFVLLFGAFATRGEDGVSPPATLGSEETAADAIAENAPLATPTVEKLHAALLGIMRNADTLGYNGRYQEMTPVVVATFDLELMASKSVGRHWKKLEDGDQERWVDLFGQHIVANYAGQFTGFTDESFETLGEEPASRETRFVRTRLTRPGEEDVQLNYRLREVDGEWRIIDIFLNGTVSELALRRSEYSSVLKREGFEKLMTTIDEKVKELAAGSASG